MVLIAFLFRMKAMKVLLDEGAFAPSRAHATDAGFDLRSIEDGLIPANGSHVFRTGVHVQLPPNTCGLLVSKSGLNVNHGIQNTGLIDEGYTGEILIKLYNLSTVDYQVHRGDKIAQFTVLPVLYEHIELVDRLDVTDRGDGRCGSSGR